MFQSFCILFKLHFCHQSKAHLNNHANCLASHPDWLIGSTSKNQLYPVCYVKKTFCTSRMKQCLQTVSYKVLCIPHECNLGDDCWICGGLSYYSLGLNINMRPKLNSNLQPSHGVPPCWWWNYLLTPASPFPIPVLIQWCLVEDANSKIQYG